MPKTVVETVGQKKCPYRTVVADTTIEYPLFEERFDFQFEEDGKIGRVSLGTFDLDKEVQSHKNEVGLINVLKLAEGRGLPLDAFAKTEAGLMADVGDVETLDDLIAAQADADKKLAAIAAQYGLTVEQLVATIKAGKLPEAPAQEEAAKEGGAE